MCVHTLTQKQRNGVIAATDSSSYSGPVSCVIRYSTNQSNKQAVCAKYTELNIPLPEHVFFTGLCTQLHNVLHALYMLGSIY